MNISGILIIVAPPSVQTIIRQLNAPDGARFNCTQCHVPQSNAMPLVDNTYK